MYVHMQSRRRASSVADFFGAFERPYGLSLGSGVRRAREGGLTPRMIARIHPPLPLVLPFPNREKNRLRHSI